MILVTGGAGYVGSQVVQTLLAQGEKVIVLDNLSTGDARAASGCQLVTGNVGDKPLLEKLFAEFSITEVMHFAALTIVSESVQDPAKYYCNNTASTAGLLQTCAQHKIKNFIFSSTAAVYGNPNSAPITEEAKCLPINPYGHSKLMSEKILADIAQVSGMRQVTLRYFNVAGADPNGKLGPYKAESTLLIRVAIQVALGLKPQLMIYGTDYNTPDGTGIRDYIHVADIAQAHVQALQYLRKGGESVLLNCGYGKGYSVREVITAVEKITGKKLPVKEMARRLGDPDAVIADVTKIHKLLHWQPQYADLEKMVYDAFNWEKLLPER